MLVASLPATAQVTIPFLDKIPGLLTAPVPGVAPQVSPATNISSWVVGGACALGAVAMVPIAKGLAARDQHTTHLTPGQARQRERGYMISFAMLGCPMGVYAANAVHMKLSEQGRHNRDKALDEAVRTGKVQRYEDPVSGGRGVVTPSSPTVEGEEECVTNRDDVQIGADNESIPVKYCRRMGSNDPYTVKTTA